MSGRRSLPSEALYHALPQTVPGDTDSAVQSISLDDSSGEIVVDLGSNPPPKLDARIRWICFMFGCAMLLPWNALITATPYFLSRLEGSSLQSTFTSYLSFTCTMPNLALLVHTTATAQRADPARRIFVSSIILASLLCSLALSTFVRPPPSLFSSFVLVNAFLQAGVGSYLQPSVVGTSALFGPTAVQAFGSGQAAVAVVVSGVQFLSAASSLSAAPKDGVFATGDGKAEESSAFVFFGLSTIFMVATTGAHAWLTTMPAYKSAVGRLLKERAGLYVVAAGETQGLVSQRQTSVDDKKRNDRDRLRRVAKANALFEVAMCYVFAVTLSVFPPITTIIQSTNPKIHPLLFSAIHFFIFNLGDFLGRFACSYPQLLIWSAEKIMALSFARTAFIPLFLMCNIQRPGVTSVPTAPIITSDLLYLLILFAFGWSNGYVASLCMMSAPSLEHNPRLKGRKEEVDVAATIVSFCAIFGLALGSLASFGVSALVCGCNPFLT